MPQSKFNFINSYEYRGQRYKIFVTIVRRPVASSFNVLLVKIKTELLLNFCVKKMRSINLHLLHFHAPISLCIYFYVISMISGLTLTTFALCWNTLYTSSLLIYNLSCGLLGLSRSSFSNHFFVLKISHLGSARVCFPCFCPIVS